MSDPAHSDLFVMNERALNRFIAGEENANKRIIKLERELASLEREMEGRIALIDRRYADEIKALKSRLQTLELPGPYCSGEGNING